MLLKILKMLLLQSRYDILILKAYDAFNRSFKLLDKNKSNNIIYTHNGCGSGKNAKKIFFLPFLSETEKKLRKIKNSLGRSIKK